jgi:hypothetical protein
MDLETVVRDLITQELESDLRLSLMQVSRKTKVDYKRLWHFMSETQPGRLTIQEAQQVYEELTDKPLLPQQ